MLRPIRDKLDIMSEHFAGVSKLHVDHDHFYVGRKLSAELLLGLSLQRGSLRYLLEWVHMALTAATTAAPDSSDGYGSRTVVCC